MISIKGRHMVGSRDKAHILLITGTPGVGKTTVLRRVAEGVGDACLCGFYTEELRERGSRRGFRLVGFDGSQGIIAHVDLPHRQRVGKYGVDVAALDRLAGATLAPRKDCALYLVDEIGKMECLSPGFVAAMGLLLDSDRPVVATIGKKGGGFIEAVKARGDVELVEVTRDNRDTLAADILHWLGQHNS
jgi:nucleoside-triphosphatase